MAHATITTRQYTSGDFVLFRDPAEFYAGAAPTDCTYVCCIVHVAPRTYRLRDTRSDRTWDKVEAEFMRPFGGAAEVMRDIDTAPLELGDVSGLESAASAWLRLNKKPLPDTAA